MDLIQAIYQRKSIRKYSVKRLSAEILDEVKAICSKEKRLYEDIDLRVIVADEGQRLQTLISGVVGSLGKVIAPHYLVVTSEIKPGYMENAGYTVERIILRLTAMGLATCWLGSQVKEYDLKEALGIEDSHEYVITVAFGYPLEADKLYRKDPKEAKRKDINEFVRGSYEGKWQEIIEAVRIAPSAANTQPWRVVIEGSKAHIYCEKPHNPIMRKLLGDKNILDTGIALSHIEIAAEELGLKAEFRRDMLKAGEKEHYITTVELLGFTI